MEKNKLIGLIAVTTIIAGGAGFWAGMAYTERSSPTLQNGRFTQFGQRTGNTMGVSGQRMRGGPNGGGFATGEVISLDDKSLTVKLPDGGSKIVFLSASTSVMKTGEGSLLDVAIGKSVMVTGSSNADGSMTAQTISVRPANSDGVRLRAPEGSGI